MPVGPCITYSQLPSKERRSRCSPMCLKNTIIFSQSKVGSVQQPQMSCYNLNLSVLSDLTSMTCTRIHQSGGVVSSIMRTIYPTTKRIFFCTYLTVSPLLISSKKKKKISHILILLPSASKLIVLILEYMQGLEMSRRNWASRTPQQ